MRWNILSKWFVFRQVFRTKYKMRDWNRESQYLPAKIPVTCEIVKHQYFLQVNQHQRCGDSDSPLARKDTFLYCTVQKWVGRGWTLGDGDTKRKLNLRKRLFFVIEKYIEDVKQDEKHVPDLLESIMRPTCLVKEELRPNLCKMGQFGWQITKIRVSTFWIPEIRCFPAGGQCQPSRPVSFNPFWRNNGHPNPNESKKCGF